MSAGLINQVLVTPANVTDHQALPEVCPDGGMVFADKGYTTAPDDNAYVERVIRTIKEEEVWLTSYDSFHKAHQALENYINFYNQERIHQALDYKTPNETTAPFSNLNAA